jgi:hypothetical protein
MRTPHVDGRKLAGSIILSVRVFAAARSNWQVHPAEQGCAASSRMCPLPAPEASVDYAALPGPVANEPQQVLREDVASVFDHSHMHDQADHGSCTTTMQEKAALRVRLLSAGPEAVPDSRCRQTRWHGCPSPVRLNSNMIILHEIPPP